MKRSDGRPLETTLEDLLVAAGEVAFEYSHNDRDGYRLAQMALVEILKKTARGNDLNRDLVDIPSPSPLIH